MVIILGNGHGYLSSNPEQSNLHFTLCDYPWKVMHSTNLSQAIGK